MSIKVATIFLFVIKKMINKARENIKIFKGAPSLREANKLPERIEKDSSHQSRRH